MIEPNQTEQEMLDPENRQTMLLFLKKRSPGINEEMFDVINRMAPLRVVEKISKEDSAVSDDGKNFLKKIAATNNGAKPGEDFEDFLWRYIESDDVPAVTEKEFQGLAEIYEKISGIEPSRKANDMVKEESKYESEEEDTKNDSQDLPLNYSENSPLSAPKPLREQSVKVRVQEEENSSRKISPEEKFSQETNNKKNKMDIKKSIQDAQINLVKELAIDQLPPEEQEKQLALIADVLQQRILLRVVEEFPEEKKEQFSNMIGNEGMTQEEFQSFVEENLPNVDELVLDEVGQYKKEMLDFADGVLGDGETNQ